MKKDKFLLPLLLLITSDVLYIPSVFSIPDNFHLAYGVIRNNTPLALDLDPKSIISRNIHCTTFERIKPNGYIVECHILYQNRYDDSRATMIYRNALGSCTIKFGMVPISRPVPEKPICDGKLKATLKETNCGAAYQTLEPACAIFTIESAL